MEILGRVRNRFNAAGHAKAIWRVAKKTAPRKWIKVVSTEPPVSTLHDKKRYCGLCKTQVEFNTALDAWICRSTKCGAVLYRGYGIQPTKDQQTLVTINDPYGDMQKTFVKTVNPTRLPKHGYHNLKRVPEHKKVKSPVEAMKEDYEL